MRGRVTSGGTLVQRLHGDQPPLMRYLAGVDHPALSRSVIELIASSGQACFTQLPSGSALGTCMVTSSLVAMWSSFAGASGELGLKAEQVGHHSGTNQPGAA